MLTLILYMYLHLVQNPLESALCTDKKAFLVRRKFAKIQTEHTEEAYECSLCVETKWFL